MSDSFVKIWTSTENDVWFKGLNCSQRGLFLQLIIAAKTCGDSGEISTLGWSECAQRWGMDRSTVAHTLLKFQHELRIEITDLPNRVKVIKILNYKAHQERQGVTAKNRATSAENSTQKSRYIYGIPERREEKTREDEEGTPTPSSQEVVDSLELWKKENVELLRKLADNNYQHVGGRDWINDQVSAMKAKICLKPAKYARHVKTGDWSSFFHAWLENELKSIFNEGAA